MGAIVASVTIAAMSDGLHLLLPLTAPAHEEARGLLAAMRLPATERLLGTLEVAGDERDSEQALSMPHEREMTGFDA